MPILKFYTSPNQLTSAEKQELATVLTDKYAGFMPAFYVNIIFHELPADSFYMAGKPTEGKFLRLTLEHIAVNWDEKNPKDMATSKRWLDFVGEVLRERFEARGWRWEFSVLQTSKELWRIQGLEPPPMGSEAMELWKREGNAVPYKL